MDNQDFNIKIPLEDVTTIDVNTESINPGLAREDKNINITDAKGNTIRTSSMMFGYNKSGIVLRDGVFVNEEDLVNAIMDAINRIEDGEVIVRKTGEKVNEEALKSIISTVKKASGSIVISDKETNVKNQDSRYWGVTNEQGEVKSKGVAFLGNNGLELESGEYVNFEEVQSAVNIFLGLKSIDKDLPLTADDSSFAYVSERRKSALGIIPITLALVTLASVSNKTVETPHYITTQDVEVKTLALTETEVQSEERVRIDPEYALGDEYHVDKGDEAFYDASLTEGTQKVMDETGFYTENKHEGDYRITGFAIYDKEGNVLLDYIEDFDEENVGYKLSELEYQLSEQKGVAFEDMIIRFHLGSNNDHTRLGWIDVSGSDLVPYDEINTITNNVTQVTYYTAIEENFDGEYVTLSNGTKLKVVDENGELFKYETSVIGSDNQHYIIKSLEVTEKKTLDSIETHKELKFTVNIPVMSAGVATVIASILYEIKKKQQTKNNVNVMKFQDDKRKQEFISDFEKAKKEYEKKTVFAFLKRVLFGKNYYAMQDLDPIQESQLYDRIISYVGPNYNITSNDAIIFEGGRIYIEYRDGSKLNITDDVIGYIKDIVKGNPITAKGMLDDEIRRRY